MNEWLMSKGRDNGENVTLWVAWQKSMPSSGDSTGRAARRFVGAFPLRETGFLDVFGGTTFSDLPVAGLEVRLGLNLRADVNAIGSGLAGFAVSS